jgi:hypothetical protein
MNVQLGLENYIKLPFTKDQNGIYLTYRKRNYYINQLSKLHKKTKNTYLKQLIEKVLNDEDFISYFYTENDIVYEL